MRCYYTKTSNFNRFFAPRATSKCDTLQHAAVPQRVLLEEGVHESAFADVGQLDRGVITALEINGSVDSLAGALFGVIDDDNSGFIDEKELQECNDKTNDNWVDTAHSDMLATLRGYRKTQRDLTKSKPHTPRE